MTCCSALLNFCVMEPHLIASDSNFHRLIQSVFSFVCTSGLVTINTLFAGDYC